GAAAVTRPVLGDYDVHLWRAAADVDPARLEAMWRIGSHAERVRAARFAFAHDRDRCTVRTGILRTLLGRYLGVEPERVRLERDARGKPFVPPAVQFNMSHSAGVVLIAVARRAVGVDVERIDPAGVDARIVAHFFSPGEAAELDALPAARRAAAFFAWWTR